MVRDMTVPPYQHGAGGGQFDGQRKGMVFHQGTHERKLLCRVGLRLSRVIRLGNKLAFFIGMYSRRRESKWYLCVMHALKCRGGGYMWRNTYACI